MALLRVADRGLEESGTDRPSDRSEGRSLSRILEDEQDGYPDEGAEKSEQRRGYRHGAVKLPGPFTMAGAQARVAGSGAGADHVRVY